MVSLSHRSITLRDTGSIIDFRSGDHPDSLYGEDRAAAHFRRWHSAVSAALMLMAVITPRAETGHRRLLEAAELWVFSTGANGIAPVVELLSGVGR